MTDYQSIIDQTLSQARSGGLNVGGTDSLSDGLNALGGELGLSQSDMNAAIEAGKSLLSKGGTSVDSSTLTAKKDVNLEANLGGIPLKIDSLTFDLGGLNLDASDISVDEESMMSGITEKLGVNSDGTLKDGSGMSAEEIQSQVEQLSGGQGAETMQSKVNEMFDSGNSSVLGNFKSPF